MAARACGIAWRLCMVAGPASTAADRVYAAYGGVHIGVAIFWLWLVDKVQPTTTDWVGVAVCFVGTLIIMFGSQGRHA